ncbi:hypothetical protein A3E49_00935 [Candidatus Saccharibacteria bacterium RIFCSPHIGHO2_12_FULL_49_19]|nr:MAG: hypothetical protein A2708_01415 [Candidatus Saccharibacteria bacterium RIFCSPHIGHO2_01_FULL_49_21]OGL36713.1 MAG: hypothetical protein A3E49_00935 [Candidatus Saccharibacteria bacterium RIFCSPHIGHO2_12_FULL_49_19]OGL37979.1 MAG: hypothetical protein A3B63_01495 [Candidatus Saccharibacteria bacterium RIFCSPLOWO2_01_FULL_49_22]
MKAKRFLKKHNWFKEWLLILVATAIVIIGGIWGLRTWYSYNLRPVSSSQQTSYFTVESGDSVSLIAKKLKQADMIRSPRVFEAYVRSNNLFDDLQAGTYQLSPSMSTQTIVRKIIDGDVAKDLLTILPGKRLDQIKEAFIKAGYSQEVVDSAMKSANYSDHPALTSLPSGANLEGYLYPESFQHQANTPAETIVRQSLDQLQKRLTPDMVNNISAQGLSLYQGIIMASMVLKESDDPDAMAKIAQVFYTRLKQGMLLQSDPTAFYAADISGQKRSLSIDSPYNTYRNPGLPPGPISNVNDKALTAVAHPANTDYLYFVAGDDGTVYFARTLDEHRANVEKYCTTACGR